MKSSTNKLTVWTIITNMAILIGAGHGVGFIAIIEVALFVKRQAPLYFSLDESYDHLLLTVALFSLIGQIILLCSMTMKGYLELFASITGLLFLYVGLIYLGANIINNSLSQFSLFFSIPFLVLSMILMIRKIKLAIAAT